MDECVNGWMDGWFRVGLCSACEGKVQHGEGGRRDGMDGMGWDGTAGRASGTVGTVRGCGYGIRQGREGKEGGWWWWVVWAEFELGCTGQKEVGGQEAGGHREAEPSDRKKKAASGLTHRAQGADPGTGPGQKKAGDDLPARDVNQQVAGGDGVPCHKPPGRGDGVRPARACFIKRAQIATGRLPPVTLRVGFESSLPSQTPVTSWLV